MTQPEEDHQPRETPEGQELEDSVIEPKQEESEAIPLGPETQAIIIQSIN